MPQQSSLWLAAYPVLSAQEFSAIQDFRRMHDARNFAIVEPHFTLVFPEFERTVDQALWLCRVRAVLGKAKPIPVVLSETQIVQDHFRPYWHLFLTPSLQSAGYRQIVALHDTLYQGDLQPLLRKKIPYIPHIGIANAPTREACETLAVKASALLPIISKLDEAVIAEFDGTAVRPLETIDLGSI